MENPTPVTSNRWVKPWLLIFSSASVIVAALHVMRLNEWMVFPPYLLMSLRWVLVGFLLYWGWKKKSLSVFIFIAMAVGIELGYDLPVLGAELKVFSNVFLRLIKSIIAPLLFGTLVVGIAGHSNFGQVGRMGLKSLIYFEVVTTIALFMGLGAIHLTGAGNGIKEVELTEDQRLELEKLPDKAKTWQEIVEHTFPENISKAIFEGAILQVVIFSILFGIAMLMISEKHRAVMLDFAESLSEVMFKVTNIIMYLAPFAVGGAMAAMISHFGLDVLKEMALLIATLILALTALILFVFIPIAWWIRLPIRKFLSAISEPVVLAFSTSSSETALPKAMRAMESIGVPRKVVSFVMPMGYSFNLDGTTLYLSLATMFVANAAGIPLSFGQQLVIVFTLMLTSKGVAGVSRASIVILAATVHDFGLPDWPIALILGVDAIMDMMRTSVNVIGNCLATAAIGKWEKEVTEF